MTDLRRLAYLRGWLGAMLGGQLVLTATLWTPQTVFPRTPLFRWAPPDAWDWTACALLAIGVVLAVVSAWKERWSTLAMTVLSIGFGLAFIADQHRIQVWAWQYFLIAVWLALAPVAWQRRGWQAVMISIYLYSALSKLDLAFIDGVLSQLQLLAVRGLNWWNAWPLSGQSGAMVSAYLQAVAWAVPMEELAVAGLLAFPRTRTLGLWLSLLLHLMLMIYLGPLGLNHSGPVVLWNVFLLGQNILLFGPLFSKSVLITSAQPKPSVEVTAPSRVQATPSAPVVLEEKQATVVEGAAGSLQTMFPMATAVTQPTVKRAAEHVANSASTASGSPTSGWQAAVRRRAALAWLAFVLLWPATEPWGYCDAWTGWAVYVRRFEEIDIFVDVTAYRKLPARYRTARDRRQVIQYLSTQDRGPIERSPYEWAGYSIPVWRWSLQSLNVPESPNQRLRLSAAIELCERYGVRDIEVQRRFRERFHRDWTPPPFTTGGLSMSQVESFIGIEAVYAHATTRWLNVFPTSYYRQIAAEQPSARSPSPSTRGKTLEKNL
jgi:hypothetical protein